MEFGQSQQADLIVNSDQTVPSSPKPQEKTEMDAEISGNASTLMEKKMECDTENQFDDNVQETPETKMDDSDDNVPEVIKTIVDPHLDTSTDPVDDGLINEIAKKADTEDRMTFCIEKPADIVIPVTSSGQTSELLVVHPVCAFARPVDMEYALVEEKEVGSELAKEVQLLLDEEEKGASHSDTASAPVSNGGVESARNVPTSEGDGTISTTVEHVVRRSQRVYNSLVGPDSAVKVVAPIPVYRKSARLSDAALMQVARKVNVTPKQVAALKGKKGKLKTSRSSPLSKSDVKTRTPVRLESMNMCNPTTVGVARSGSAKSSDGKGIKKLPKFLSQYSVKTNSSSKKKATGISRKRSSSSCCKDEESRSSTPDKSLQKSASSESLARKALNRKRTSSDSPQKEEAKSSTPDKPIQKSASTVNLIRKLKMRDGGEIPTPRRSQRIYNSLNGPKETVNVITPVTRDYRPANEVVYNSLVGEDNDVKLEIPKIRKRTIKKEKPVVNSKKSKVSTQETSKGGKKPTQGYSKFDRVLLTETNPGRPMGIVNEFSQPSDIQTTSYSRSRPKRLAKDQKSGETGGTRDTAESTSPTVSEVSDASVLVASSYFTTRRGTQTKVVYSTPATLSSSTSAQKRPAMSASVQRNLPGQRKQRLGLAPDQPGSGSGSGSSSAATTAPGSERARRSTSKKTEEGAADVEQQLNESKEESSAAIKKSRSSSKLK